MKNHRRQNGFVRGVKKFFLSAFVVLTFAAYALENRASAGGSTPAPTGATARAPGIPPAARDAPAAAAQTAAPDASAGTLPPAAPDASAAAAPAAAPDSSAVAAPPAPPPAAPAAPPTAAPTATAVASSGTSSGYKDGTYTGPAVDVRWGNVQVQATIRGGKISDVQFLQYPNDRRTSVRINSIADPELQQEAIQAQSANVDLISGATLTSEGFQQSLETALGQARG